MKIIYSLFCWLLIQQY